MSEKRRDNRNRILRNGESQRSDGRYRFKYIDLNGEEKNIYYTTDPKRQAATIAMYEEIYIPKSWPVSHSYK